MKNPPVTWLRSGSVPAAGQLAGLDVIGDYPIGSGKCGPVMMIRGVGLKKIAIISAAARALQAAAWIGGLRWHRAAAEGTLKAPGRCRRRV